MGIPSKWRALPVIRWAGSSASASLSLPPALASLVSSGSSCGGVAADIREGPQNRWALALVQSASRPSPSGLGMAAARVTT